jgi:hypothetical protein
MVIIFDIVELCGLIECENAIARCGTVSVIRFCLAVSYASQSATLCGLSMMLVEPKQRAKLDDNPKPFTVNISSKPSRKLAAALGYSCSSHCACFSKPAQRAIG